MNAAVLVLLSVNLLCCLYIVAGTVHTAWKLEAVWQRVSHILAVLPGDKGIHKGRRDDR